MANSKRFDSDLDLNFISFYEYFRTRFKFKIKYSFQLFVICKIRSLPGGLQVTACWLGELHFLFFIKPFHKIRIWTCGKRPDPAKLSGTCETGSAPLVNWLIVCSPAEKEYVPSRGGDGGVIARYIGILNSNSWPTDLIRNSTVKKRRKFSLKKGPFCTVKLIFANGCGFFKTILLKLNFRYNVLNWTFSTGIQYKA